MNATSSRVGAIIQVAPECQGMAERAWPYRGI
jgi:hypothetical protein